MIKSKGLKAIVICLLIVFSTSCFSLMFVNVYKAFTKEEPQAASTYNFDTGSLTGPKRSFWEILGSSILGIELSQTQSEYYYKNNTIFEISSIEGLGNFAKSVAEGYTFVNKTVKLTTDLDFSTISNQSFAPIGARFDSDNNMTDYVPFSGTFDGQNHVIRNINMSVSHSSNCPVGFFASVGYGLNSYSLDDSTLLTQREYTPTVTNLMLKDFTVTVNVSGAYINYVGAISGAAESYDKGSGDVYVYITNCAVDGFNVNLTNTSAATMVGGLVGLNWTLSNRDYKSLFIENCLVYDLTLKNNNNKIASNHKNIRCSVISPAYALYGDLYSLNYQYCYDISYCITNVKDYATIFGYWGWEIAEYEEAYVLGWNFNAVNSNPTDDEIISVYFNGYAIPDDNYEVIKDVYVVQIDDMGYYFAGDFAEYSFEGNSPWFEYYEEYEGYKSYENIYNPFLEAFLTIPSATASTGGTIEFLDPENNFDNVSETRMIKYDTAIISNATLTYKDFAGITYTLTAKPSSGYKFVEWIDGGDGSFAAIFEKQIEYYAVTFKGNALTDKTSNKTFNIKKDTNITVTYSLESIECKFTEYGKTSQTTYKYSISANSKYIAKYYYDSVASTSSNRTIKVSKASTFAVDVQTKSYIIEFG